ncbi:hypothetical protein SF1_09720 [Sphingobacterium faecium NBRC 15299]|nr:hypothetical protein SF1_09720 [Sphingobacterium faecium NBRC 15299]
MSAPTDLWNIFKRYCRQGDVQYPNIDAFRGIFRNEFEMLKQHSGAYAEYDKDKIDHFELENRMNGRSY